MRPPLRSVSCLSLRLALLTSLVVLGCVFIEPQHSRCGDRRKIVGIDVEIVAMDVEIPLLSPRLLRAKTADLSQLHPDNWVPARPAESRSVSPSKLREADEQASWHSAGRIGTERDFPERPDNAEVAGSIPASPGRASASRSTVTRLKTLRHRWRAGNGTWNLSNALKRVRPASGQGCGECFHL